VLSYLSLDRPWAVYAVWIVCLPAILRVILLLRPAKRALNNLSPHAKWAWKRLKEVEVEGFQWLIVNELIAFLSPVILVIIVRITSGPIGPESWDSTSNNAMIVLCSGIVMWVLFDLYRIMPTRRLLQLAGEKDVRKLRMMVDGLFATKGIFAKFAGWDPLRESDLNESPNPEPSVKGTVLGVIGVAKRTVSKALSAVQGGAAKTEEMISGVVRRYIERRIHELSERRIAYLLRDISMAIFPIALLWIAGSL